MEHRKYIIENGEPVEAQVGDTPTHILVPIDDYIAAKTVAVESIAAEVYAPNRSVEAYLTFEEFWKKYPRKVAKKEAMKAWAKMDAGQRRAAIETIGSHSWVWANEGRGSRTVPHAATWLNGERWEDEVGFAPETDTRIPNNRTTRSQDVLDQMEQGQ